jgi:hypothetical protein
MAAKGWGVGVQGSWSVFSAKSFVEWLCQALGAEPHSSCLRCGAEMGSGGLLALARDSPGFPRDFARRAAARPRLRRAPWCLARCLVSLSVYLSVCLSAGGARGSGGRRHQGAPQAPEGRVSGGASRAGAVGEPQAAAADVQVVLAPGSTPLTINVTLCRCDECVDGWLESRQLGTGHWQGPTLPHVMVT